MLPATEKRQDQESKIKGLVTKGYVQCWGAEAEIKLSPGAVTDPELEPDLQLCGAGFRAERNIFGSTTLVTCTISISRVSDPH
jgi:hypothetical protein